MPHYKPRSTGQVDRAACEVIDMFERIYRIHPGLVPPGNSPAELALIERQIVMLTDRRDVVLRARAALGQGELFA